MRTYYDDGKGIVIYHGDNRQILPELGKADLTLTDPPYGMARFGQHSPARGDNHTRGKLATAKMYGKSDWDLTPPLKSELYRVMATGSQSIIWGGNYFDLPVSPSWLVWDKDNGQSDYADCELAWTNLGLPVRRLRFRWSGMLQENMREKEIRVHPTQKPVPLMTWCISLADNPQTILDPFMGSGTTLRAAKDLGRKAIGIEIEERYCSIAAKRLEQECLPLYSTGQDSVRALFAETSSLPLDGTAGTKQQG